MRISYLCGRGAVVLAGVLLTLISTPASAHHTFDDAEDLGTTTGWDRSGKEYVGEIPDARDNGWGYNHLKFEVAVGGNVNVWTSGGHRPTFAMYDANRIEVRGWSTRSANQHLEAGTHYIVASSRSIGDRYRIHIAGGGRGHDDIGNIIAEAAPMPSCRRTQECKSWNGRDTVVSPANLDYGEDRDWFTFEVPDGVPVPVRIWSSGGTDTYGVLYDENAIELESDYGDGGGDNFYIRRILRPGTYYIGILLESGGVGAYGLHLAGQDDHGNYLRTASRVRLPTDSSGVPGELDYTADGDNFWFRVSTRGNVRIWSSGGIDTYGVLYDEYGIELERDYSDGPGDNFRIDRILDPGVYYVGVAAQRSWRPIGPFNLHLSGDASGVLTVPLLPADGNARGQQGFVRVTNHSDQRAEVVITAVDDTGMRSELSSPLTLAPWQTRHFNSRDLERGNPNKGIASGGVGDGTGNWYLEVAPDRPEVEVLSYIRTSDGFLTSMHTQAPSYGRTHRVATFNPGRNRNQASRLRLINLKCPSLDPCDPANVTIYGVDDAGKRSPNVRLTVADGAAREVTAAELEGLDAADGLDGAIGTGSGKWQLFVTADRPIQVMSLLESISGHLTNLSAPASRQVFSTPERPE